MPGSEAARREVAREGWQLSGWVVLLAMLVVPVGAVAAIVRLRIHAQESRDLQERLTGVEAGASRLNSLRWLVFSERAVSSDLAQMADQFRRDLRQDLEALDRLNPDPRVRERSREYLSATDDELRLIADRRFAEARTRREDRGDPSYTVLMTAIAETRGIASERERRASHIADLGSAAVLGFGAAAMGLLFWRFNRERQAARQLATKEQFLRQSEQRLRGLVENATDVIMVVDAEGRIGYVAPSLAPILAGRPEDWLGTRLADRVHPDDVPAVSRFLADCVNAASPASRAEFRWRDSGGEWRHFEALGTNRFQEPSLGGIVLTCWDITERKRAADETQRNTTLAAVGQLASGVAHHLNNVLAVILGRAQLLERDVASAAVGRGLQIIIQAARDGAAKIGQLQSFARVRAEQAAQPVAIDELLREVVESTAGRWRDEARARGIRYDVALDLTASAVVEGSAVDLRDAFTNLVINGLEAMPGGGALSITSRRQGAEVNVRITDAGTGLSAEARQHLFEPFYTTKGPAGNGLGLPVSYSIVQRHGGRIEVESEPGRGTAFTVSLRISTAPREPETVVATPAPVERLRILVVDDNEPMRDVLSECLRALGHEVVSAGSGKEALGLLDGGGFGFVFTDLSMPDMDGWTVAQRVRERQPAARVVLITGYGASAERAGDRAALVDAVLSKPVGITELESTLNRLRASNGPSAPGPGARSS